MADLQRTLAELESTQAEIIGALNEDHALQGLFIDTMARRLRALAEEALQTGREKDAEQLRSLEQGMKLARAERLTAAVDRAEQHSEAKQTLLDTLEHHVISRNASLPQD